MLKVETAHEAIAPIRSGQTVFIHGCAATPLRLIAALIERESLRDVEIVHIHTMGDAPYARPEYSNRFRVTNMFLGGNVRPYFDHDRVDYLPCMLSEIPNLMKSGRKRIDVALITVSPPDAHGYCSLGTSVDVAKAAVEAAACVIAQVNKNMPRTHGDTSIPLSAVDVWYEVDDQLPEAKVEDLTAEDKKIGQFVASLVEDGSTLQAGIGAVPDAVLAALANHKHLGLHTETFSDHALELIEQGVIDNSRKHFHPGVSVAAFCSGTKHLYQEIHDNPGFAFLPANETNAIRNIARNPKVVAINSAVEIDLTGQVCADSIGSRIISGVGGQLDFMMGASMSEGGKPIIAMQSRTSRGCSKITPTLQVGAGVVTTRAHVHFVVTEFGVADLYGRTLNERAQLLINIAHPDDRESLARAWHSLIKR